MWFPDRPAQHPCCSHPGTGRAAPALHPKMAVQFSTECRHLQLNLALACAMLADASGCSSKLSKMASMGCPKERSTCSRVAAYECFGASCCSAVRISHRSCTA